MEVPLWKIPWTEADEEDVMVEKNDCLLRLEED